MLVFLVLLVGAMALDCKRLNLESLDFTMTFTKSLSSPHTTVKKTVYFNPCSAITGGHSQCANDDHLCVVQEDESSKEIVKSYGSVANGAVESFTQSSIRDNTVWKLNYSGAVYGNGVLEAGVLLACGKLGNGFGIHQRSENEVSLEIYLDELCADGKGPKSPDKDVDRGKPIDQTPSKKDGHWGIFHWVFFLVIFGAIIYVLLTIYVNFAQSRGNLPLAADLRDIVQDLPYLLRDALRKVKSLFSSQSRSGYSAL